MGWYSTGPKIKPCDIQINTIFKEYSGANPNPVFVVIDVHPKDDALPIEAYVAIEEQQGVKPRAHRARANRHTFRPRCSKREGSARRGRMCAAFQALPPKCSVPRSVRVRIRLRSRGRSSTCRAKLEHLKLRRSASSTCCVTLKTR